MAKRVWTFGVLLLLAGAVFLNRNLAQGQDALAEIDGLLLKGKEELEPCREFRRKAELPKWKEAAPESPSHLTKADALEALELLETYPGIPPSHHRARRLYEENLEALSSRVDQVALIAAWGGLESDCDPFFFYTHSRKLLNGMDQLGFSPFQRRRVRTMIASYLKNERPAGSLIGVVVRASLLRDLAVSERNNELRATADALVARADRKIEEIRQLNRAMPKWKWYLFSSYEPEIRAAQAMDIDYAALVARARI